MRIAKIGLWAGSLSLRLTEELKAMGLKEGDTVDILEGRSGILIKKITEITETEWYGEENDRLDEQIEEESNRKD